MKKIIYIENSIKNSPRTNRLIAHFKDAKIILIERYTEVFNKNNQNFKMQKKKSISNHCKEIQKFY